MGDNTGISWCEATWNPLTGCKAVSPGCDRCYSERQTGTRLRHHPAYAGLTGPDGKWTGEIRRLPERLDQPLRWRRGRRVFVNSMSDLFHPDVPESFIADVFAVMALAPWHIFQVLTKRAQRMADLLGDTDRWLNLLDEAMTRRLGRPSTLVEHVPASRYPMPWIHLGVSVETQAYAFRARYLAATPAAVRWVSAEPLLGPLDLTDYLVGDRRIDWIVAGGESGPGARPAHPDWFRDLRDQCLTAGIPYHLKQWGEHAPLANLPGSYKGAVAGGYVGYNGEWDGPDAKIWRTDHPPEFMVRVGKKRAGRMLDGREWDEFPEGVDGG